MPEFKPGDIVTITKSIGISSKFNFDELRFTGNLGDYDVLQPSETTVHFIIASFSRKQTLLSSNRDRVLMMFNANDGFYYADMHNESDHLRLIKDDF